MSALLSSMALAFRRIRLAPPRLPERYDMGDYGLFMREETFLYSPAYVRRRVLLEGSENLTDLADKSGVMVAFLHYGSWILAGGAISHELGLPYTVVASRRNLEILPEDEKNFWYGVHKRCSELYGHALFYSDQSPRLPLAWLEEGNILGIVLDVREVGREFKEEEFVFLGRKITMQTGPARLACISGVPIVPATICYHPKERRHHLHFDAPIHPDGNPRNMTQALLDILGRRLADAPDQQFYDIIGEFGVDR